jgi:hypothetical protein
MHHTFATAKPESAPCCRLQALYKLKLAIMLRKRQAAIVRCSRCGDLYSHTAQQLLLCSTPPTQPAAAAAVAADAMLAGSTAQAGSVAGSSAAATAAAKGCWQHQADHGWRHASHLQQQRQAGTSWRHLYWQTWGLINVMYCHACETYFPASKANCCRQVLCDLAALPRCSQSLTTNPYP